MLFVFMFVIIVWVLNFWELSLMLNIFFFCIVRGVLLVFIIFCDIGKREVLLILFIFVYSWFDKIVRVVFVFNNKLYWVLFIFVLINNLDLWLFWLIFMVVVLEIFELFFF